MDDEANDVCVGDTLTNILAPSACWKRRRNKGSSPKWRCAPFSKTSEASSADSATSAGLAVHRKQHRQVDRRHLPIFVEVRGTHVLGHTHQTRPVVQRGGRVVVLRSRPCATRASLDGARPVVNTPPDCVARELKVHPARLALAAPVVHQGQGVVVARKSYVQPSVNTTSPENSPRPSRVLQPANHGSRTG